MTPTAFSRLASIVFAVIAAAQLARAILGFEVVFMGMQIPTWPNWIAFVAFGALAWLGFATSRN